MEKRYKLDGKITFYTSGKNKDEAKKAFYQLEHGINNILLTDYRKVVSMELRKVDKLLF